MKARRILISILVIAMLTTVIVIPTAITDAAYACARLNLLRGEENGITDEYLSKETTRAQSLLISLRLNGLERSARYFKGDYNFNDLSDLNKTFWQPILAYAYAHPELGYIGDGNGSFRPSDPITGKELAKVMLESLGYKQSVDFEWVDVKTFAESKGLTVKEGNITNADLAEILIETMKTNNKEGKLYVDALYEKGLISDRKIVMGEAGADPRTPYVVNMNLFANADGYLHLSATDQYGQPIMVPSGTFTSSDTSKIVLGDPRPGVNPLTDVYCDAYGVTSGTNTAVISFISDDGAWNLSTPITLEGKTEKNIFSSISFNQKYQALLVGKTLKINNTFLKDSEGNDVNFGFHQYYLQVRRMDENNPYGAVLSEDLPVFEITRDEINGSYTKITAKRAGTETLRIVACKGGMYGSTNPNYIETVYEFTLTAVEDSEVVGCRFDFEYGRDDMYAGAISEGHNLKVSIRGVTVSGLSVQLQSTNSVSLPDVFSYKFNVDNVDVLEEKGELTVIKPVTEDTRAEIKIIGKNGYVINVVPFRLGSVAPSLTSIYMSAAYDYVIVYAYDQYGKYIQVPNGTVKSSDTNKITISGVRSGEEPLSLYYNFSTVGDGPNTAVISYVSDDGLYKCETTVTR
jgi:hypothetical protein